MKGLGYGSGGCDNVIWSRYSLGIVKIWSTIIGHNMVKMWVRYGQDWAKI